VIVICRLVITSHTELIGKQEEMLQQARALLESILLLSRRVRFSVLQVLGQSPQSVQMLSAAAALR
jgi:hypothetical protein